jgi:Uncharacterised nucleotidyltransferase
MADAARTRSNRTAEPAAAADDALRFFDRELHDFRCGVDLVRLLVGGAHPSEPTQLGSAEERSLPPLLAYHRLLPQVIEAVADGQLTGSDNFQTAVAQLPTRLAVDGLRLEHMLLEVGERFDSADIEVLVLKGVATGRLDHAQPGMRQAADVDVLVHLDEFDRAGRVLAEAGFLRPDAASTLMDKGESWRALSGVSLDLHTRPHTAGRGLGDSWWRARDTFLIAGRSFRALERGGRLAHAASHFALSFPNHRILSSLLDLVTISTQATAEDRARAEQFLAEVGVSDIVHRITRRAAVLVGDEGIVLGRPGSRPLDLALRKAYDRSDLDKVALKLAKTFGMPRTDKMRVVRNWVAPSDDFLAMGGYTSRWDRLGQVARRRRSRGRIEDDPQR